MGRSDKARSRATTLVLAAMLATAGLALVDDPGAPTTEFEDNGGTDWTSHDGELAFLAAVDAASDRVEIDDLGTTVEGRPLHLVRLGAPTPLSIADAAATERALLVICTQHGNEPSGREMCLQALRDLALTDDADTVELLADFPVFVIPTANPDGRAANDRENADGFDVNRDHLHGATPEGNAIASLMRDLRPAVTVDHHEMSGSTRPDLEVLWPTNLNVDQQVHDLAMDMVQTWVRPHIEAAGHTTGLYPGSSDERILRNTGGLRHGIGMLAEANKLNPAAYRVISQRLALEATIDYLRANVDTIVAANADAAAAREAAGTDGSRPVYWSGSDTQDPGPTGVADPPPCGYDLTDSEVATASGAFTIFGLTTTPIDREPSVLDEVPWELVPDPVKEGVEPEDHHVSMAHPFATVIPLLLDDRATYNVVVASPTECADTDVVTAPTAPWTRVPGHVRADFVDVSDDHAA